LRSRAVPLIFIDLAPLTGVLLPQILVVDHADTMNYLIESTGTAALLLDRGDDDTVSRLLGLRRSSAARV
jgi:hypothetical protein